MMAIWSVDIHIISCDKWAHNEKKEKPDEGMDEVK